MLQVGVPFRCVSCLTRRVCHLDFERPELRKHSGVGREPACNGAAEAANPGKCELSFQTAPAD